MADEAVSSECAKLGGFVKATLCVKPVRETMPPLGVVTAASGTERGPEIMEHSSDTAGSIIEYF